MGKARLGSQMSHPMPGIPRVSQSKMPRREWRAKSMAAARAHTPHASHAMDVTPASPTNYHYHLSLLIMSIGKGRGII